MSEKKKGTTDLAKLMAAVKEAEAIREKLREDPEVLDALGGSLQELDEEIEKQQEVLNKLNAEKATITQQIALIKGTTAKKRGAKGATATRGRSKLAAEYINTQGVNAVITIADLKVPEIGMKGGYPGTWLGNMTEQGYFEKIGQGEYKVIKLLPA